MIGVKNDSLDALILLSAHVLEEENVGRFCAVDTANAACPASLNRKIRRLIKREQNARYSSGWLVSVKRIAAAILVFCTVAFAAAMSIEAVRNEVWQAIVQWYDTYIAISFVNTSTDADPVPETIQTKREPADLPSDWVKEVRVDSQSLYKLAYLQDGKKVLTYRQLPLQSQTFVNSEGAVVNHVEIGTYSATLVALPDEQYFVLYWSDGKYNYALHSATESITPELMIHIAVSVK